MSGYFLLATVSALMGSIVLTGVALLAVVRGWRFRGSGIMSVSRDMRRWLMLAWAWYGVAAVYALTGVLVTTRWH